jgi:uncharacterized protein (DUF1800 family)
MRYSRFLVLAGLALPLLCFSQQQALSTRAVNRILEQGTWGPVPGASGSLQTQGFDAWFAEQVAAPVSTYPDQPLFNSAGNTNTNLGPVQIVFFQNAVNGPDQLRQRVAFALSEIWVISNLGINNASAFPPLLRIFQADAFANYETLMRDVTLNPGMGRFLNMVNNDKANPAKGTSANENYGREFMQLFTLGLTQLNTDGTPVLDSKGVPLPTYKAADVTGVSRAFTGWTYPPMPGFNTSGHNRTYYIGPMVPLEYAHDAGAKTILGTNLPPNRTAEDDLTDAIHIIFMQPTLPPFVCQQLIEHLVTSNPSPAYISRVAEVFENNGSGIRGDLKAVIHAILADPEARAADEANALDQATFGHMREPVLFVANLLRGLNGTVTSQSGIAGAATNLGQQLFYAPSVFSYFSPQYRGAGGLLAPEFQIYSTQTSANRINLVNTVIYAGQYGAGTKFDISSYTAAATVSTSHLLDLINSEFFHQDMSNSLRDAINQALAPLKLSSDKAKAALYLALTSSEYQIIH